MILRIITKRKIIGQKLVRNRYLRQVRRQNSVVELRTKDIVANENDTIWIAVISVFIENFTFY